MEETIKRDHVELLPCPLCGDEKWVEYHPEHNGRFGGVKCQSCGIYLGDPNSIEKWNKREVEIPEVVKKQNKMKRKKIYLQNQSEVYSFEHEYLLKSLGEHKVMSEGEIVEVLVIKDIGNPIIKQDEDGYLHPFTFFRDYQTFSLGLYKVEKVFEDTEEFTRYLSGVSVRVDQPILRYKMGLDLDD